jgi:hypothetical protein
MPTLAGEAASRQGPLQRFRPKPELSSIAFGMLLAAKGSLSIAFSQACRSTQPAFVTSLIGVTWIKTLQSERWRMFQWFKRMWTGCSHMCEML